MVAQEVRALAQRSAEAARQIKELITKSGQEVKSGVALVDDTGAALGTIIHDVKEISDHIIAIVEASREQSTGLAEINTAVGVIDQGTQQNAAMVEETSAASQNLASEVEQLNQLLGGFQLGSAPAERPREAAPHISRAPAGSQVRTPAARPQVVQSAPRSAGYASRGSVALAQLAHASREDGWEEF